MSLVRGRFGIEFTPKERRDRTTGVFRAVFVLLFVAAAVSLCVTVWRRRRVASDDAPPSAPAPVASAVAAAKPPPPPPISMPEPERRPAKVRNLLLRLQEAERQGDVEMAATTIETLRSLPGEPAADLDDRLARRLGELNLIRLFDRGDAKWVAEVVVKSGDSATRIAREHGSTLASMMKLNGWKNADCVRTGTKVKVMDHPRFNLVVRRRLRTADLQLNGRFFRRYDLAAEPAGKVGAYEHTGNFRKMLGEAGVVFSPADRLELEMLMARRSTLILSEL